jgi:transcription initiation factor TFIIH subunit 3
LFFTLFHSILYSYLAGAEQQDPCTALACGLSRALCLINRITTVTSYGHARSKPRIVCIIGSPDVPLQYIPVMNAIFSAQVVWRKI